MRAEKKGYLSRRLPLGRNISGWVVERPELHLPAQTLATLRDDLRTIAQKTLPGEALDYGVFQEGNDALSRSLVTILYERKTGHPLAFNSMPILDVELQGQTEEVLHLGLVMVDPDARSGGLSALLYGFACILMLIRRQFRPVWVSSVTQVPAVVGLVSELYSNTYPTPEISSRRSFTHLQIARRIMEAHRSAFGVGPEAGFDEDSFVITNAYTGGSENLKKTFEEAPKHRNEAYNEMCEIKLDYARGDDFLQIGKLDAPAVRHYFMRKDPDALVIAPLVAILFFSLQSIFFPVLHWFDNRKHLGELRPWKS